MATCNYQSPGVCSDPLGMRKTTGYLPIENYGLIGNMRTCALVGMDSGIDFLCWPEFDSPMIFCRLMDKNKGGFFSICPHQGSNSTTKQQYLPSSNILQTRYIQEEGVVNLVDYFPRPKRSPHPIVTTGNSRSTQSSVKDELKQWLVRRVECIRGQGDIAVKIFPAFNYAQDSHSTELIDDRKRSENDSRRVVFKSRGLELQVDVTIDCGDTGNEHRPKVLFKKESEEHMLGDGVVAHIHLDEGQAISFVLREHRLDRIEHLTKSIVDQTEQDTLTYWHKWISQNKSKGRFREVVARSLMILKLLTYEPTGAIIAAPTFSLPEDFGGSRNWDYRFSWVRDSSFTIYILLRMGFTDEAEAYMGFISDRLRLSRSPDGALPIMFGIRGETKLDEIELSHLEGYRGSKPVRIGNGAAFHKQLDIYGELMDSVYLYNKYGKPVSWDIWVAVRELIDYISGIWHEADMSIWEVRGQRKNFVYSKIMLWVAFDRALRLADKRCFPCPHRQQWLAVRDEIYESVMDKGFNKEMNCFTQSYEERDILDSAVLIAPLVFFVAPNDPRFIGTLEQILKPPREGRFDQHRFSVGGREGSFSMCTFWLVEALTRAGAYDPKYLVKAINLFENMLSFSNHLSMFSEEIAKSGEQLGNTPQAFSHLALISAAFNLDRTTSGSGTLSINHNSIHDG
ncbi:MAG: hypothetical protein M1812_002798 [Candelaria pacifica]|nr:MAG: hypothetical protein M1812_002798 [Candelaria pacifica]